MSAALCIQHTHAYSDGDEEYVNARAKAHFRHFMASILLYVAAPERNCLLLSNGVLRCNTFNATCLHSITVNLCCSCSHCLIPLTPGILGLRHDT